MRWSSVLGQTSNYSKPPILKTGANNLPKVLTRCLLSGGSIMPLIIVLSGTH